MTAVCVTIRILTVCHMRKDPASEPLRKNHRRRTSASLSRAEVLGVTLSIAERAASLAPDSTYAREAARQHATVTLSRL